LDQEVGKVPYALTERQKEYLDFIREYIRENEMSPGLDEIARHFGVKPPTAHKILDALQAKGYIYSVRSRESGFFIRLVERAGMREVVMHVPIVGKVDYLGEVLDFPEDLGEFPDFFFGAEPYSIFALILTEDIPNARMRRGDSIVFDLSKKPQPGDICILPIGQRLFLAKIGSKTIDRQVQSLETSIRFPIPTDLIDPEADQLLNYYPLALKKSTEGLLIAIADEQNWPLVPLPSNLVVATALHLWRVLEV
jgi:SOS-response transcriptional repressor LexA